METIDTLRESSEYLRQRYNASCTGVARAIRRMRLRHGVRHAGGCSLPLLAGCTPLLILDVHEIHESGERKRLHNFLQELHGSRFRRTLVACGLPKVQIVVNRVLFPDPLLVEREYGMKTALDTPKDPKDCHVDESH